jgi:ferredoxin
MTDNSPAENSVSDELPSTIVLAEEEGLFSRDVEGRLIRAEKATLADLEKEIRLTIDDRQVTVKKAVPEQDSQGRIIRDEQDQPKPRATTIYDAASHAFIKQPCDPHPIPTLCHKEHLPPVGVCRVCLVEAVERSAHGTRRKLVPACKQAVSEGMEVHTDQSPNDPDAAARVRAATRVVVELLATDHLPQRDGQFVLGGQAGLGNDLADLAERFGIQTSRFAARGLQRGHDASSHMIVVDHDQCIMCGRCVRGCNWVKGNDVIGRSSKGYATTICFDLGEPMGESSCVSCAECVISCPTGAMEFKPEFLQRQQEVVVGNVDPPIGDGQIVPPEELAELPMFRGIPFKFLQLNALAVVRRQLQPGDVLCREGEYGSTAFLIERGSFKIFLSSTRGAAETSRAGGLIGWLGGLRTRLTRTGGDAQLGDVQGASLSEGGHLIRTAEDVILGEMTCMNRYPRSATVVANEPAQVLEIRRNVLYMLQRNEVSRALIETAYRNRALVGQLEKIPFLQSLAPETRQAAAAFLKDKVDLVSAEPGQLIFAQGDTAEDFYIVKLGFVKVTQTYGQNDRVLNYLSPGTHFGEIGLLSGLSELAPEFEHQELQLGKRTATCSALDHVELIRLHRDDFRQLLLQFPELRPPLMARAKELLARDRLVQDRIKSVTDQDYLEQGLYLANSLLILDLERCTRCDECTKACADTHDGVTRLIRDGLRFDRFLVASSCRSCMDPYCLVGCPVDAIHRNGESLEITIEDYCIGCGLCASNCPYGNINMHQFQLPSSESLQPGAPSTKWQATTCDLCRKIDGKPSCVYACPHNAAFRMSGEELLRTVRGE